MFEFFQVLTLEEITGGGLFTLLAGTIGFLVTKVVFLLKEKRSADRLDQEMVATNLQKIIDELWDQIKVLETENKECIARCAAQAKEISILWYNVKKLRAEIAEMKSQNADNNYPPSGLAPWKNDEGS